MRQGSDEDTLLSQHSSSLLFSKLSNVQQVSDIQQTHTLWKTVFFYFTGFYSYDGRGEKEQTFAYFESSRHPIYEPAYIYLITIITPLH